MLGQAGPTTVTSVPVPHDCNDGFAAAFWRRPRAYLDPAVRAGMSLFATAHPQVVTAGATITTSADDILARIN